MSLARKLLADDETLVLLLRPHIKRLLWPVVVLLVVAPIAAYSAGMVPQSTLQPWLRLSIAIVAALIVIRFTLWPFLIWWNTIYVITDRRLVVRQGVFNRSGHDMPLSRLNDVSFSHGLIDRLLGCGTLVVESAGERGQLTFTDLPKVEQVQRTLYRLSDDARSGESFRQEQVDPEDER